MIEVSHVIKKYDMKMLEQVKQTLNESLKQQRRDTLSLFKLTAF